MMTSTIEDEDESCPRCGGDHSWCQSVQPGEFGPEDPENEALRLKALHEHAKYRTKYVRSVL